MAMRSSRVIVSRLAEPGSLIKGVRSHQRCLVPLLATSAPVHRSFATWHTLPRAACAMPARAVTFSSQRPVSTLRTVGPYQFAVASYAKGGKGKDKGKEDNEEVAEVDWAKVEKDMEKQIEALQREFSQLQTGRANPAVLENITFTDSSNKKLPLKAVGQVIVRGPQQLVVNVYDKAMTSMVDKAIRDANLGFNSTVNGNAITVAIPKLSKESRDNLVKIAHKSAEQAKERIRGIRRDQRNDMKKMEKSMPDEFKKLDKRMQDLTDKQIKKIEDIYTKKEKEIKEV